MRTTHSAPFVVLVLLAIGCSHSSGSNDANAADVCPPVTPTGNSDAHYACTVPREMQKALLSDVLALHSAALDLQKAAPTGHGWDATADADALVTMKAAWTSARTAYERTEGALAPLFPQLDAAIDARYDDFLSDLVPNGDQDLFDDHGVTGMHAIERILFVQETPARIVEVEASLPGYKAAAWPSSAGEAAEFKEKLCGALVADTQRLATEWAPQNIDLSGAYDGLVALMNEQREKIVKAASDEEESRYSQRTMTDIRDNLEGTRKIYELFKPYLKSKTNANNQNLDGPKLDVAIEAGLAKLDELYAQVNGEAIPTPPATWSSESPSAADLESDFGRLYTGIQAAVAMDSADSVVVNMNHAATVMGFDRFAE